MRHGITDSRHHLTRQHSDANMVAKQHGKRADADTGESYRNRAGLKVDVEAVTGGCRSWIEQGDRWFVDGPGVLKSQRPENRATERVFPSTVRSGKHTEKR